MLRRDGATSGHFRSPGLTPAIAAVLCAFLIGPWVDRDALIYQIAGGLMLIGIVLWVITYFINRSAEPSGRPGSATLTTWPGSHAGHAPAERAP